MSEQCLREVTNANGVTYYIFNEHSPLAECINIDIPKYIDTLELDGIWQNEKLSIKNYNFTDSSKTFPWITTLKIGKYVRSIKINNEMFPNIRKVISENHLFLSGTMLMQKVPMYEFSLKSAVALLNTFCLKEDETADLRDVNLIEPGAFDGCKNTKFVNTQTVLKVMPDAFHGSAMMDSKEAVYMAGSIVVNVDYSFDEIEIPGCATCFSMDINFQNIKKLILNRPSQKLLKDIKTFAPDQIKVCGLEKDSMKDLCYILSRKNCSSIEVSKSIDYKSMNGILYNKNGSQLIKCPAKKAGTINIPEGVTHISDDAFYDSDIEKVILPDSVQKIGRGAFGHCQKLKEVVFGNGLTEMSNRAFMYDQELENINLPDSLTDLAEYVFFGCAKLTAVNLPKNLRKIDDYAFFACPIKKLVLPESLVSADYNSLINTEKIVIKDKPTFYVKNFFFAISSDEEFITTQGRYTEIEQGERHYFIPKTMPLLHIQSLGIKYEDIKDFGWFTFYKYGANSIDRYNTALAEYYNSPSMLTDSYIRKFAKTIAKELVKNNQEKDLVKFLKEDFLTKKARNEILKLCIDKDMPIAVAYILETQKKNTKKISL